MTVPAPPRPSSDVSEDSHVVQTSRAAHVLARARSRSPRVDGKVVLHPRGHEHDRVAVHYAPLVVLAGLLAALVAGMSAAVNPLAPLGLACAGVLFLVAWSRPVVASVVVAAVVPALSGLGRGIAVPGMKLSELLLLLCAVAVFVRRPDRWRPLSATDLAFTAFALVGAGFGLYHAVRADDSLDAFLRVGLQPFFLLLAWWTASRGVRSPADLRIVLRWVLLVSTIPAALAVLQRLDVPGVRSALINFTGGGLLLQEGQEGLQRITGPFPIWHSLGGYLLIPAVLAVVLLLRGDRGVLPAPVLLAVLAVQLTALVLALTVTIFLWVPVAILVAAARARRLTRALAVLLAVGVAAAVFASGPLSERLEAQVGGSETGEVPQTLEYRILVWQRDFLPLLEGAAALGYGNEMPASVIFDSTENQFLTLALRGGIWLVLGAVVAFLCLTLRASRHARTADGPTRAAALTCFGVLAFLPAAAMVWPYVTNAGFSQMIMGFAGAALALEPRRRRRVRARGLPGARHPSPTTDPAAAG